jgi:hypothetical protein
MRRNTIQRLLFVIATGVIIGLATSYGQTYLPGASKQLANSYSVWLLGSFLCGSIIKSKRVSIVGGALVQYLAIFSYYITSTLRFNTGFNFYSNTLWLLGGTFVGPLAAWFGYAYIVEPSRRTYATIFMASLFFSEVLYQFIILKYFLEGYFFIAAGVVFLVATTRQLPYRASMVMMLALTTIVMFIGYGYILVKIFK